MSVFGSLKARLYIFHRNMRWGMQKLYVALPVTISEQRPDFLCIGAPKAATTWLHARLDKHPEVFLPDDKELHFFDTPYKGPDEAYTQKKVLSYYKPYDLSSKISWRWYSYQFQKAQGRIKGDITPTYGRASSENISKLVEKIPDIKIIYILRNPVERAWSGASYFMHRWHGSSMDLSSSNAAGIIEWVLEPERLDHGFYTKHIDQWEKHIDKKNILYVFYDDIQQAPGKVLQNICEFIGIDKNALKDNESNSKVVNSAYPKYKITKDMWCALYDVYRDEIEALEARFERDLSAWKTLPN